jgi:hypothetical protein
MLYFALWHPAIDVAQEIAGCEISFAVLSGLGCELVRRGQPPPRWRR